MQAAIKDLPASAQALAVAADVTDEDEVAEYVRAAVDKFGTIDAFYNNAGIEGDIKPITGIFAGDVSRACSTSTWSACFSA